MRFAIKLVSVLLVVLVLIPYQVFATNDDGTNRQIVRYDDGSYMVIDTYYINTRATSTRAGYKTYTRYSAVNQIQWVATLSATFEYDNHTAVCLGCSCNVEISDTNWYTESKSASKNGATATAQVTMARTFLGIKVNTEAIDLSLTCLPNGDFA